MSILIKGMEMPKGDNWITVRIYSDGTCGRPDEHGDYTLYNGAKAAPVHLHGRLIDADELAAKCDYPFWCVWKSDIDYAPTVIPAEEDE